jgi:excisionase family DNA binding protein
VRRSRVNGSSPSGPLAGAGHRGSLLCIREVAALLGVSTSTVYAMCEAGVLAAVRTTANSIRIARTDRDSFVEARRIFFGVGTWRRLPAHLLQHRIRPSQGSPLPPRDMSGTNREFSHRLEVDHRS